MIRRPPKGKSLAEVNPLLAKEWHATKNGELTPHEVTYGSSKRVWWKCPKGDDHEWKVSVSNRKQGWGCPICSGQKVVKSNSLGTLSPGLAREWHPTRNGDLTPFDVSPGSQKKAWWKCPKGEDHEWDAVIADRNKGIGCAICSNYKVVRSNCLATLNPELAKEWHPTKNGNITPYDVHPGSSKKIWWKCPKGDDHEWRTVVHSRINGRGCPVCSGRKVVNSTCLATLNPELAKQWHPTKNGKLTPYDVSAGSGKIVWWKCPEGKDHEWKCTVHSRSCGLNCPVCSNQKVVLSNCLATLDSDLAREWHPTKNGDLTPYDVTLGSGKAVWWKCPKGEDHIWRGTVGGRKRRPNCPICVGRKVVLSNSFGTLHPELAKEWHPTKNGDLTPYDLRPGSQKRVWWQCLRYDEHIWKTSISERTNGTRCPKCNPSTSMPELRIFCELKSLFPSTQHRAIIEGYEVDIYLPDLNLGIEYDGSYWHRDKVQLDREKNLALQSTILLLRVREKGLPKLSETDIQLTSEKVTVSLVKKVLQFTLRNRKINATQTLEKINMYLGSNEWIASDHFDKLQAQRNRVVFENSIGFLFPDLAKQWHPSKNGPLLPEHFTPGSHKKAWWQDNQGNEWQESIEYRVRKIRKREYPGQTSLFEDH